MDLNSRTLSLELIFLILHRTPPVNLQSSHTVFLTSNSLTFTGSNFRSRGRKEGKKVIQWRPQRDWREAGKRGGHISGFMFGNLEGDLLKKGSYAFTVMYKWCHWCLGTKRAWVILLCGVKLVHKFLHVLEGRGLGCEELRRKPWDCSSTWWRGFAVEDQTLAETWMTAMSGKPRARPR